MTNKWITLEKCLKNNFNNNINLEEESMFANPHEILSNNDAEDNQISNDNKNLAINMPIERKENANICDVNIITSFVD